MIFAWLFSSTIVFEVNQLLCSIYLIITTCCFKNSYMLKLIIYDTCSVISYDRCTQLLNSFFRCYLSDDFAPATTLLNMAFTFYHVTGFNEGMD